MKSNAFCICTWPLSETLIDAWRGFFFQHESRRAAWRECDIALKSYRKPLRAEYFFAIIANRLNTPGAYEA
jgi:hypothetical protein